MKSVVKDYELMLDTELQGNNNNIFLNKKLEGVDNFLSDKAKSIQKRINKIEDENKRILDDKQQLQEFKKNEGFQ